MTKIQSMAADAAGTATAIAKVLARRVGQLPWVVKWLAVMVILGIVYVSVTVSHAEANDPRKKPINLTLEQAAGKCIGEVQLDYQAKGLHAVARTEDFSVTGNDNGQMGLIGKVTIVDLSTGGTVRAVNCLIDAQSSGSATTTTYRVH